MKRISHISPRDENVLIRELCVLLTRRRHIIQILHFIELGILPETIKPKIFGVVEFLIAEALARLLGLDLVITHGRRYMNDIRPPVILWNGGLIIDEGEEDVYEMSRRGIPDIEYYTEGHCEIIEVTLGSDEKTLLYEIGELMRHTPYKQTHDVAKILVAPDVSRHIVNYALQLGIHIVPLHTIINGLLMRFKIREVKELSRLSLSVNYIQCPNINPMNSTVYRTIVTALGALREASHQGIRQGLGNANGPLTA